jgi:hypothetical protein
LGHASVADDAREDLIEIVSHAAGQLAHHLHFLGLAQLVRQL